MSARPRLLAMAAALVWAAAALPAGAVPITFNFSHEFSGSGDVCANGSCATLEVEQNGADLDFKLTGNLAAGEFITGLYGNLDPFGAIGGAVLGGTGADSVAGADLGLNEFKADGDGYFDWIYEFNKSPPRFSGTDTLLFRFLSVDISRVVDAISVNGPVGKNGFTFALRVQGLGAGNEGSGWFDSNNSRPPPVSVPEPMTLALFGVGLAALGLVRRRRRAV